MKLSREIIDDLFEVCYEDLPPQWQEEFAKFLFSHFYYVVCIIGDEDTEIDMSAIDAFRISFKKNMEGKGLEYIQNFFKQVPQLTEK